MEDVDRALAQIGDIRAQLAASTRFRGYAPEALVLVAAISLMVTLAQTIWPDALAQDNGTQVLLWGMVLLGSFASIAIEAGVRSRRQHGDMGAAMLRGALALVLPVCVAAVVLACGIALYAPEALWIVPAIWLFMIALAAFSSRPTLPAAVLWPAVWYLFCAIAVVFLAGPQGRLAPWMMGVPMTVGHLAMAWALRSEAGSDKP